MMMDDVMKVDLDAARAEQFGKAYLKEQSANYGCSGEIECTFKMDGNCACFNTVLSQALATASAEAEGLRDILQAVKAETMGEPVGGGDGSTYVVHPISGKTYNRIVQALAQGGRHG
jgi:hypothetical protein